MTLDGEFRSRLAALLEREGAALTEGELTRITERYPRCPGTEQWDVRAYARVQAQQGAREYRVMRGSSVQDVYASVEPGSATALRTALNELESQEEPRKA